MKLLACVIYDGSLSARYLHFMQCGVLSNAYSSPVFSAGLGGGGGGVVDFSLLTHADGN